MTPAIKAQFSNLGAFESGTHSCKTAVWITAPSWLSGYHPYQLAAGCTDGSIKLFTPAHHTYPTVTLDTTKTGVNNEY